MKYILILSAISSRGRLKGSDTYQLTDEDFEHKPAFAFQALLEVMALRAAKGPSAWQLPGDEDYDDWE
jgi:hypothetical protein